MGEQKVGCLIIDRPIHEWTEWKGLCNFPHAEMARNVLVGILGEAMSPRARGELRYDSETPYSVEMLASVLGFTDVEAFKECFSALQAVKFFRLKEDGTIVVDRVRTRYAELEPSFIAERTRMTRAKYSPSRAKYNARIAAEKRASGILTTSEEIPGKRRGRPKKAASVQTAVAAIEPVDPNSAEDQIRVGNVAMGTSVRVDNRGRECTYEEALVYVNRMQTIIPKSRREDFARYIADNGVLSGKCTSNVSLYLAACYRSWMKSLRVTPITEDEFRAVIDGENKKRKERNLPVVGEEDYNNLWLWVEPRIKKSGPDTTTKDNVLALCESRIQYIFERRNAAASPNGGGISVSVGGVKSCFCKTLGTTVTSDGTHWVVDCSSVGGNKDVRIRDNLDLDKELKDLISFWNSNS